MKPIALGPSAYIVKEELIVAMGRALQRDPKALDDDDALYVALHFAGFSEAQIEAHGGEARRRGRWLRDRLRLARAG